jgi:hypothetical protein
MKWKEEYWGSRIKCPKCKQIFVLQKPGKEQDTEGSFKTAISDSLNVEKEAEKSQKDKNPKPPDFNNQSAICAGCGGSISANEASYEIEGQLFCVVCAVDKQPEQVTSKSQGKPGVADEIQVKCKLCQTIYAPDLKLSKAWTCPKCKGKNPNLKRHYRSVADVCILSLIGQSLLLYAGSVHGRLGFFWILGLVQLVLLLLTIIFTYSSAAPWMDGFVKIMIVVVFGLAAVFNIGFLLVKTPGPFALSIAGVYSLIWIFLFWLWIQTKKCTV